VIKVRGVSQSTPEEENNRGKDRRGGGGKVSLNGEEKKISRGWV